MGRQSQCASHRTITNGIEADHHRQVAASGYRGQHEGARYRAAKGVAAVGADSWGLEVIPFEKDAAPFKVHEILLPRSGVCILENMNTEDLVKEHAFRESRGGEPPRSIFPKLCGSMKSRRGCTSCGDAILLIHEPLPAPR